MNIKDIASQLANRINQPDAIEVFLRQVYAKGFVDGTKQFHWISVKERLPYDQDIVLVRGEYGGKATAYYHGRNSGFITYGEEAYKVFGEVTHWMPIPACEE